jgi:hypothetical protein
MRVLHIKIKEKKHKMKVLLNSKIEICIKKTLKITILPTNLDQKKMPHPPSPWRRKVG